MQNRLEVGILEHRREDILLRCCIQTLFKENGRDHLGRKLSLERKNGDRTERQGKTTGKWIRGRATGLKE